MKMNFEKKINLEIKILGVGLGLLTIFCSYHQFTGSFT